MFRRQKNNAARQIAVDLGAYRTRFYAPVEGLLLDQPSVALQDMDHPIGGIEALTHFGDQAELLAAQGLDGMRLIQPVQSDQHNDLGLSAAMLTHFLKQARQAGLISKSTEVILMLPNDTGDSTIQSLQHGCNTAGMASVAVQCAETAALHATDLNPADPCILLDFGATSSRIFAVENDKVIYSRNLSCGGDTLDQTIASGMVERFSLYISNETARQIKHSVAAATPHSLVRCTSTSCKVNCLSVKTNSITTFRISSDTVNQILQPTLAALAESIKSAVAEIDSTVRDAANENGTRICGGGAMLPRMDQLVLTAADLPVQIVRRPQNSNVRGAAATLIDADTETPDLAELI